MNFLKKLKCVGKKGKQKFDLRCDKSGNYKVDDIINKRGQQYFCFFLYVCLHFMKSLSLSINSVSETGGETGKRPKIERRKKDWGEGKIRSVIQ